MNTTTTHPTPIYKLRQGKVDDKDIKWDLNKISEQYDGLLNEFSERVVRNLFVQYLGDLKYARLIGEYSVSSSINNGFIAYDVSVKMPSSRSPKKIRVQLETHDRYKKSRG